ncbi:hypothetical protein SCLCIDRAFT_455443 [Scleroderma citrinum Foug A]|uniref:Uncharacterized protein n=1 Tax=Scleroderma citrinum Foug A TaxID=1036808 RepID=A0A0C2ZKL4_9AGAM|nr:hypothetical protein SCLCIDRAFT_455443 [Scleroderma citrinum Foug A]
MSEAFIWLLDSSTTCLFHTQGLSTSPAYQHMPSRHACVFVSQLSSLHLERQCQRQWMTFASPSNPITMSSNRSFSSHLPNITSSKIAMQIYQRIHET